MAQVRARISCQTDCADLLPSTAIRYTDVWTDPVAAGRAAGRRLRLRLRRPDDAGADHAGLRTRLARGCRITIHYERHIHPLWSKPRVTLDADGSTVLRDDTCTTCHSRATRRRRARVPAAQLDLTDGPSADVPTQFHAYRELLAADAEQEVVNGAAAGPPGAGRASTR